MSEIVPCTDCLGEGSVECSECWGAGRVKCEGCEGEGTKEKVVTVQLGRTEYWPTIDELIDNLERSIREYKESKGTQTDAP